MVYFCGCSGQDKSERDLEKKRLEYEFNEQDQTLNKLVEGRHINLINIYLSVNCFDGLTF